MNKEECGRFFRNAWIEGVRRHYPGTPKDGYISPWESMQMWEKESAIAVYEQVAQFVVLTAGRTRELSREQRGRFVCICWIGQVFRYFSEPKASYVADWNQLPQWQQEVDADIFGAIEKKALQGVA